MVTARARIFSRGRRTALAAAALAATALGGCAGVEQYADFGPAPIDPASPVAAAVAAGLAQPQRYPDFADIPRLPTDVRPPEAWRAAVLDLTTARDQLYRETAPETFTLNDSEGFADAARGQARPPGLAAPTAAEQARSEAEAAALRARATPPPRR